MTDLIGLKKTFLQDFLANLSAKVMRTAQKKVGPIFFPEQDHINLQLSKYSSTLVNLLISVKQSIFE